MGYDEWKAEQRREGADIGFWEALVRTVAPPQLQPETLLGEPLWKGLEAVGMPFAWSGMKVRAATEARTPFMWSSLFKPPTYQFPEELPARGEPLTWQTFPPSTFLPGGEQFEEYRELPMWQQLLYEAPSYAATALLPTKGLIKAPKARVPKIKPPTPAVGRVRQAPTFREIRGTTAPATNAQKIKIHQIARTKNLISELGKPKPQYRRLALAMTGRRTAAKMTQEEADIFIRALDTVVLRGVGKPPKIPITTDVITQKFAEKIPMLQEVGALERVRPSRQVFEKMGLRREVWEPAFETEVKIFEDLMLFRREVAGIKKLVSPARRPAIFQALENPAKAIGLTGDERVAYDWFKKYFDDWAVKLKLPATKTRKNYVTHIFEEAIRRDLAAKHPLDPEIIRAMDFASPKTVFNPFLQRRLGQTTGLIEDPFLAASAYEARALRVFHYEPLLQRIRVFEKYLPPNSARYLRDFTTRITNRPLPIDREINQTLKEFAVAIRGMPYGERLAAQLTRGNAGGLAAYNYTSLLYFLWLGFKPTSAIRNLSQHFLVLADVGPIHFAKGLAIRATPEGRATLAKSLVLRSRKQAYMPGIDTSFASRWVDKTRETALKMFRWADRQNVSDSFLAGYSEAKALGLPERWAILRGDEVAANTQYIYTRLGGAQWSQNTLGRVLSPLTTWPANWLELLTRWTGGRGSYVYREYATATGKQVAGMAWDTRRKALMLYLTLVGTAYAVQAKTPLRASEYTGWTSIRYLQDIAAGELPGLEFPRAFAEIIGGSLTGDTGAMKTGWSRIRPDRMMGIIRQLERVAEGKADWLSLFVYLNPEKSREGASGLFPGLPKMELPELELPKLR